MKIPFPKLTLAIVGILILAVLAWPRASASVDGEVEALTRVGADKVELSGWALDAGAGARASSIFVTVNGRMVAQGKPSDVRRPHKFPTVFHIVLDRASIEGDRPRIAVFVATKGGVRELNYANGLTERYRAAGPTKKGDVGSADVPALRFGMERRADRLTLLVEESELAMMATDSAYRGQAGAATNTGRRGVIAGASAEGVVDGYRQAARFGDALAMAATPDGQTLFVIDGAAKAFRRVDVATGLVETVASFPASSNFTLIAVADRARFFAYDAVRQVVVEFAGAGPRELPAIDTVKGPLDWLTRVFSATTATARRSLGGLAWANGRLFAIGSELPALMSLNGANWDNVIAFPREAMFDRFAVTGADSVVVHSTRKNTWQPYRLSSREPIAAAVEGPSAFGIAPVGTTGRAIGYNGATLYDVPVAEKWGKPAPLELFNVEGKPLGPAGAHQTYKNPVVGAVTSLVVSRENNDLIILDQPNHRIVRLGSNRFPVYDKNPPAALNSQQTIIGPEYRRTKPWGVNRILWMSHSVYWDPDGDFVGNLAYSAPARLEQMLNAGGPVHWEVLLSNLTGNTFYSGAYPMLKQILSSYGVDYAVAVVDLHNFLWFMQSAGLSVPVMQDADGAPVGVDVAGGRKPAAERSYPPDVAALNDHILANYGIGSAIPLMGPADSPVSPYATGNFVRVWSEDAKFRALMGTVYVNLLRHLNDLCREKGVRLIVAIAPTINFVAANDWSDPYRLGGEEKRYDTETVHRPLVTQLAAAGIDTIDISYALTARQIAAFPYNTGGAHHTHLFHEAVAAALHEQLLARGMISSAPQPSRAGGRGGPDGAAARNKIYDYRDGHLVVLHDLWNGTDAEPPLRNVTDSDFPRLLELALQDAETYIAARGVSPKDARVDFVHVMTKDEYANMDLRSVRPVSSMLIRIADLQTIKQLAGAKKWDEVKGLVRR